jgi:nucleoporin SEH1
VATCSADQRIKIFHKSAEDTWEPEAEWKVSWRSHHVAWQADKQAHDAPLLRLAFAHPLHGSLIASCSHDRTVRVWEEPSASTSNAGNRDGRWIEKGILTGAKGSVRSVEFAPPSPAFGLRVVS